MTTDIGVVRWEDGEDFEYDGGNSSSRLFERSRIRALAGETFIPFLFPLADQSTFIFTC
jgi:spectrin beta